MIASEKKGAFEGGRRKGRDGEEKRSVTPAGNYKTSAEKKNNTNVKMGIEKELGKGEELK